VNERWTEVRALFSCRGYARLIHRLSTGSPAAKTRPGGDRDGLSNLDSYRPAEIREPPRAAPS
jgi:hypothetical protein